MEIKKIVEEYNKIATDNLKSKYLKDNLHVKTYIPYLTKVTIADKLARVTTLDKESGNVKVNSSANYLLFCRMIIEQYTDLHIETEGFYEEYDLLNESGILDKIMQEIPEKEIGEFKMLCDFSQEDLMTNMYENHVFISSQVDRFRQLIGITLKPVLDNISEQLENMDEKDIEKAANKFDKILKKFK